MLVTLKTKSVSSACSSPTSLPFLLLCFFCLLEDPPPDPPLFAATPNAMPRAAAPTRPAAPRPRAAACAPVRPAPVVRAGIVRVRAPVEVNVEFVKSNKAIAAKRQAANNTEVLILKITLQLTSGKFQQGMILTGALPAFIAVQKKECITCG